MKTVFSMVCLVILSGCAAIAQLTDRNVSGSYVAPEITGIEAEQVALDAANLLAGQLPPAKTTIALTPMVGWFQGVLVDELKHKGFGVVEGSAEPSAVLVRYVVTPFDGGVIMRLRFGNHIAGRFYPRLNTGGLSFSNKYAVREVKE